MTKHRAIELAEIVVAIEESMRPSYYTSKEVQAMHEAATLLRSIPDKDAEIERLKAELADLRLTAGAWHRLALNKPKPKEETPLNETVDGTSDERTVNNVMRHQYRVLSDNEKIDMQVLKDVGLEFHTIIETLETRRGGSRELALAKTKIEEAVMWAAKHITE